MATNRSGRLLIIDDESNMRHMLASLLRHDGFMVDAAEDGAQGLEKVRRQRYQFVLCDIRMPRMDGMAFLQAARAYLADTTVIMMSAYGSVETAVEAMKLGAYDYISKPFKADEVTLVLKKAEERESLRKENRQLRETIRSIEEEVDFGAMLGKSPAMQAVFGLAEKVALYDTTVLIGGASGTGKELMARGIHQASRRRDKALVAVNCGGIPENLMESEMFGYKRGAFTGADRDKQGLFSAAHKGTIFLDEIGELPGALQVKLLRVLQEGEIRPVGGSKTTAVDVRIIAATAKDLETEVARGRFRQDLFYRLNVMPIRLPELKDRMEDLPLLCRHFLHRLGLRLEKKLEGVSPAAMSALLSYGWPGNVRELKNVLERAAVLTDTAKIKSEHLPAGLTALDDPSVFSSIADTDSLKVARQALEREMIARALKKTGGNRTQAARLLEISHPSLLSKIKTYGLNL